MHYYGLSLEAQSCQKMSTSRSGEVATCEADVSVLAIYASCPRPIFGPIVQVKVIKWVNSTDASNDNVNQNL